MNSPTAARNDTIAEDGPLRGAAVGEQGPDQDTQPAQHHAGDGRHDDARDAEHDEDARDDVHRKFGHVVRRAPLIQRIPTYWQQA